MVRRAKPRSGTPAPRSLDAFDHDSSPSDERRRCLILTHKQQLRKISANRRIFPGGVSERSGAVFALSLSSVEAIWRSRGYRPTVPESLELWHFWRERVRSADGHVVAVLGTSRVMADISLATMSQCLPSRRIVQLGISGSISSVKILNDLLDDPKFVGTVICELDTPLLDRTSWGGHEQYLEFRPPPFPAYSEIILRDLVDDRLISLRSPCTLRGALMRFFGNQREFLRDEPRQTFRREWQYDFSTVADLETLRRNTTAESEERYNKTTFEHGSTYAPRPTS